MICGATRAGFSRPKTTFLRRRLASIAHLDGCDRRVLPAFRSRHSHTAKSNCCGDPPIGAVSTRPVARSVGLFHVRRAVARHRAHHSKHSHYVQRDRRADSDRSTRTRSLVSRRLLAWAAESSASLVHAQPRRSSRCRTPVPVRCTPRTNDRNEHFVRVTCNRFRARHDAESRTACRCRRPHGSSRSRRTRRSWWTGVPFGAGSSLFALRPRWTLRSLRTRTANNEEACQHDRYQSHFHNILLLHRQVGPSQGPRATLRAPGRWVARDEARRTLVDGPGGGKRRPACNNARTMLCHRRRVPLLRGRAPTSPIAPSFASQLRATRRFVESL